MVKVKTSTRKKKQPEPLAITKTVETKTVFELPEKQVAEEADEEEEDA